MSAGMLHNPNNNIMKEILIFFCALLYAPFVDAGWFESKPDPNLQKLVQMETQLRSQQVKAEDATFIACLLGGGCLLLLVIGTALGAKTRKTYDRTRRMGSTSQPTAGLNGRNPWIVGEEPETDDHTTLAA